MFELVENYSKLLDAPPTATQLRADYSKNKYMNFDQKEIITKNAEETRELGKEFAKKIHAGDVVALYGDLGAGKTHFVQGLAEELGITRRITSPTFVILRTYSLTNYSSSEAQAKSRSSDDGSSRQAQPINFYHVDLYRINKSEDVQSLGLLDILKEGKDIVVIEWAEKMEALLPEKTIRITFETTTQNERKIVYG